MKLRRLSFLIIALFSMQSFADIVVFDNTHCSASTVHLKIFKYFSGWSMSYSDVQAGQMLVVDTGEHVKRGDKFMASHMGMDGPSCEFVANGGTHYFIMENDWQPMF